MRRELAGQESERLDDGLRVVDVLQPSWGEHYRDVGQVESTARLGPTGRERLEVDTPVDQPQPGAVRAERDKSVEKRLGVGRQEISTTRDEAAS